MTSETASDEVVWITGGGSGLGRALALEFSRRGAVVAVSGRRADRLAEVVSAIQDSGGQAYAFTCDVTDETRLTEVVAEIVADLGGIDVVVANAGYGIIGKIVEVADEYWKRQFDVNVFGLLTTVRHALPHVCQRRGRVVLISSVRAFIGAPGSGVYGASKAAVRSIGHTLNAELVGTGVTCTTIFPGYVKTEISRVDNDGVFRADRKDRMPAKLMWPADKAAKVMWSAIEKRKREYVFTGHGRIIAFIAMHFPKITMSLVPLFLRSR